MKKYLLLLLLPLAFFACEEDNLPGPAATVNLRFFSEYNGQPLVLGKSYPFLNGKNVEIDTFSFFIANVALLEAETDDELDFLETGLVDFSGGAQPAVFTTRLVPAVKYKGLRLSIGVPSGLNKPSILNYGSGHPVRQAYDTHFWKAGGSFFFMKLKGTYDLSGNGTFTGLPEDHPFELYPVKNSNFTTLTLLRDFTIQDGQPYDLDLTVDVLKLLQNGTAPLDLSDPLNLSTYNPENAGLSQLLMENFTNALK